MPEGTAVDPAGRPSSVRRRVVALWRRVPGVAPRAPKRNLLVLVCYLLAALLVTSTLAAV
jgi:hypothetical protein